MTQIITELWGLLDQNLYEGKIYRWSNLQKGIFKNIYEGLSSHTSAAEYSFPSLWKLQPKTAHRL